MINKDPYSSLSSEPRIEADNEQTSIPKFDFETVKIGAAEIYEEVNQLIEEISEEKISGLFDILPVNDVMKVAQSLPDPIYLYDVLILENEISILFADTGIGKSALAVQMAIETAKKGLNTLYLDLELTKKQFQKRYTNDKNEILTFPDNLYRLDFARLKKLPKDCQYVDYFFDSLIPFIEKYEAKVLFLDNLTKLAAGDTDSAKSAIPILEKLNELKVQFDLTIVVLEHNKKVDTSRPISLNDLQGSKMKSNLVDSVFSIGKSEKEKTIRYIKQLKVRDGELFYDTENVKVFELSKSSGFLFFTELGYGFEYEHLKQQTNQDKESRLKELVSMKEKGFSNTEIAKRLSVSEGAIRKWLKKIEQSPSK